MRRADGDASGNCSRLDELFDPYAVQITEDFRDDDDDKDERKKEI